MKIKYLSEDGFEFESEKSCQYYEIEKEKFSSIKDLPIEELANKKAYKISSLAEFVWALLKIDNDTLKPDTFYNIFSGINFDFKVFPLYFFIELRKSHTRLIANYQDELNKLKEQRKELDSKILELKNYIKELKNK